MDLSAFSSNNLFDFTFNAFAIFPFLGMITGLFLFYLLNTRAYPSLVTRLTAIFVVITVVSGLGESLARSSVTPFTTDFWQLLNLPVIAVFGPFVLTIALAFTGREKIISKFWYQLIIFGPGIFFMFLGLTTPYFQNRDLTNFHYYYYGWNDSGDSGLFWADISFLLLLNFIGTILIWKYLRKLQDPIKRKQTQLLLIAFIIPLISGGIVDGVIQGIFGPIFPLTSIDSFSITVMIIAYAILRYKLFVVNPSTVAANIIETMNEILVVFNPNSYIDFANNAVENILGYKKSDLVNKNIETLIPDQWEQFKEKIISPVKRGEAVSGVELKLKAIDGESVPVAFSASSIRDNRGTVVGIIGIASDLRKIKSLTATIEQTKSRLESINTIINSVVNGILVLDFDNRIVLANPSVLNMLSLKSEAVLNKKIEAVLTLKEKGAELDLGSMLTDGGNLIEKQKLAVLAKGSGQPAYADVTAAPIKNGKEFGLSSILVLIDKTKEVQLEEMKLDFVSMAAHELRTPLTAIRGYTTLLVDDLAPTLDKEHQDQLLRLNISAANLNSLIENLLNVSRIERGALRVDFGPVDMGALTQTIINSIASQAKMKKQKLNLILPDKKLPLIIADKFRMTEVIQNLLANALNYTQEGGEITAQLKEDKGHLVFWVKDNGQGIPKEALPNLFTKFFRVAGNLEQGSKGTGLGLYISKSIIDIHHGQIWVESTLGKGSTFYFKIPITKKEVIKKEKESVDSLSPASGHGIFINQDRARRFFNRQTNKKESLKN